MEEFDNKIILNDESGNEVEFEFLDLIEYQGEEFVVLLPCDEPDDAGEVVILKLEDTGDEENESYASVDDESVLNAVFEIFKDKFKDEFNFVDCDQQIQNLNDSIEASKEELKKLYFEIIAKIIHRQVGVKESDIHLGSSLRKDISRDQHSDFLDIEEVFMEVEEKFNIETTEKERTATILVEDLINLIIKKLLTQVKRVYKSSEHICDIRFAWILH